MYRLICILLVCASFCRCSTIQATNGSWSFDFSVATSIHSPNWDVFNTSNVVFTTTDMDGCNETWYQQLPPLQDLVIFLSDSACKLEEKIRLIQRNVATIGGLVYHREIAAEVRNPPGRGYKQPLQLERPVEFPLTLISYQDYASIVTLLLADSPSDGVWLQLSPETNQWKELFESGLFLFVIYFFVAVFLVAQLGALYKLAIFGMYATKVGEERYNEAFFMLLNECVQAVFLVLSFIDYYGHNGIFTFSGLLAISNLCIVLASFSNLMLMMLWLQTILGALELPDMKSKLVALQKVKWPFIGIVSAQLVVFIVVIAISDTIIVFTPNTGSAYFFTTYIPALVFAITLIVYGAKLTKMVSHISSSGKKKRAYQRSILPSTLISAISIILLFLFEAAMYVLQLSDIIELALIQVLVRGIFLGLPMWIKVWYFNPIKTSYVGIDSSKTCLGGFFLLPTCVVGTSTSTNSTQNSRTKTSSGTFTDVPLTDISPSHVV